MHLKVFKSFFSNIVSSPVKESQKQTLLILWERLFVTIRFHSITLNPSGRLKHKQEKVELNFKSQNKEIYSKDFNLDELVEAIQRSHDEAMGPVT